jgi:O-antigen ligase
VAKPHCIKMKRTVDKVAEGSFCVRMSLMGIETSLGRPANELRTRSEFRLLAAAGTVAVMSLMVLAGPLAALVALCAVVVVLALALRPHWSVYATLFLGATTFPAFIPYQFQVGSTTVFTHEPALLVAAAWALCSRPRPSGIFWRVALVMLIPLIWGLAGLLNEYPQIEVIGDARGLVDVALCALVVAAVYGSAWRSQALRVLLVSLWVSAGVTLISSVTGLRLTGRSEDAGLVYVNGASASSSATRLLTPSSELAVIIVSACIALFVLGRFRQALPFFVPALLITALGFSRNSVLAIAAAAAFALLAGGNRRSLGAVLKVTAAAAALAGLVALGSAAHLPGTTYVVAQVQGFATRVIDGLGTSAISVDSSAIARESENRYALQAIHQAPTLGHGLGYAYRPPAGPAGSFSATKGQYYAHNFYLWLLAKTGVVGLVVFLTATLRPLVLALRGRTQVGVMLSASGVGLLVSLAFAPFVNDPDNGGSMAVGIILGAMIGFVGHRRQGRVAAAGLDEDSAETLD